MNDVLIISEQKLKQIVGEQLQAFLGISTSFPSKPHEDELLTIEQAAQFLSMAVPSVYGLVHKRAIPFCKPSGKRLYFSKKELAEWVNNGRVKTLSEISTQAENYFNSKRKGGRV